MAQSRMTGCMCAGYSRRLNPKKQKREYERLLEIRDNYPKYVLETDELPEAITKALRVCTLQIFY